MKKRVLALILIVCLVLPLTACQRTFSYSSDKYFGAYSELNVKTTRDIEVEFDSLLKKLNSLLSATVEGSDVDKFNNLSYGQTVEINELTFEVLTTAKYLFEITDGYFDPTVYTLVDLWGFTPRFKDDDYSPKMPYDREREKNGEYPLPDGEYLAVLSQLVDFEKVVFYAEKGKYYLKKDIMPVVIDGKTYEAKLDLGGLAKGFACQKVSELVKANGATEGYFSCGGSSISVFSKEYEIAVKNPRAEYGNGIFAQFSMKDKSLSTSGDYENYYYIDNVRYCHIINPKTGYPIKVKDKSQIASATILGDNGAVLDGLSTAVMCMEEEKAVELLNSLSITYIIVREDLTVLTNVDNLTVFVDPIK